MEAAAAAYHLEGELHLARPPFKLPWLDEDVVSHYDDHAQVASTKLSSAMGMTWVAAHAGGPHMEPGMSLDDVFLFTSPRADFSLPFPWHEHAAPVWVEWPVPVPTAPQLSALGLMPAGDMRCFAYAWFPKDLRPRAMRLEGWRTIQGYPCVRGGVMLKKNYTGQLTVQLVSRCSEMSGSARASGGAAHCAPRISRRDPTTRNNAAATTTTTLPTRAPRLAELSGP